MGYETKLLIGTRSKFGNVDEEIKWFNIYASIDLCKCGYDSNIGNIPIAHKGSKPLVYWYGFDGNLEITKDRYDEMPKPISIQTVIKALEKDIKVDQYHRFKWALSLLNGMQNECGREELEVLFYGH